MRSIFRSLPCLFLLLLAPLVTPVAAQQQIDLDNPPIEIDPQDPKASREERIRRARELIKRKLAEKRRREEEERRERLEQLRQQPPQPTEGAPATMPTPGPAATPKPSLPQKMLHPQVTIYLAPASESYLQGDVFPTEVRLLNTETLPIDRVRIVLTYPADTLEPVSIHHGALAGQLAAEPEVLVDEERSILIYDARFAEPIQPQELTALTIEWEAEKPASAARIDPWLGDDHSAAYYDGRNLTRGLASVRDALVGSTIRIARPGELIPQGVNIVAPALEELNQELAGLPDQSALRLPTLWIDQPESGILEAGQWLVIDLGIQNPDSIAFDEIRLAGRFDPTAIEIIDTDLDNLIDAGTNLLDGPFLDLWNWDIHYENHVDNQRGYFEYRMGTSKVQPQPSAPIARIFARVKRPTEAPVIKWIWNPLGSDGEPATGVYLLGRNVYLRDQPQYAQMERLIRRPDLSTPIIENVERANPDDYRF